MDMLARQYRIDGAAGRGGFSNVYRGYDVRMERNVAIKEVMGISGTEAKILKALEHKALPRLYDIIKTDDKTYLVMEWIEGISLQSYIEDNGPVCEARASQIGTELLDVLKYLHGMSPAIIYQDLKPANIMLKPDGHIKLIDFGTALVETYSDETIRMAGTVGYGSPEQRGIKGVHFADTRSDIYSWGAVMYSMLSGRILSRPPYTMGKIRQECPQISFGLERIIAKSTMRDNEKRYENVEMVKRAMNNGYIIDVVYRGLYLLLMMVCICPFAFMWYKAYKDGVLGICQSLTTSIKDAWLVSAGNSFTERISRIVNLIKSALAITRQNELNLIRMDVGLLMVFFGWMCLGVREFKLVRYVKIKRSVFLSDKHYPGIWIAALIAGLICGYGIGESSTFVTYAADNNMILPVSFINEEGEQFLLDMNTEYDSEEDINIIIEKNNMWKSDSQNLKLILTDENTGQNMERVLHIK